MLKSVIIGTGAYLPSRIQHNEDFAGYTFYDEKNQAILKDSLEIAEKLSLITGIAERRYVSAEQNTSGIAAIAASDAIEDSGIDAETLDYIIVAHNFGNVSLGDSQADSVPSLASRVKHTLGIQNPSCIAYDLIFGCPGWLQSMIHADAFCRAGIAKKCLLIGAETLSRVVDKHDRDSLIYADGAGACILNYTEVPEGGAGMLASAAKSYSAEEVGYIHMGPSYFPDSDPAVKYLKMKGRKVYEFAMTHVPTAMKECLESVSIPISEVKKIFIHQANEKMDEAIIKRFYQLFRITEPPADIMPMNIHKYGNSSVATIPTLFDAVRKGKISGHELNAGDIVLFASIGAGMNINAVCYRI